MKANDAAVTQGSEFPDWMTPYDLRAALKDEFPFDLDLAASVGNYLVGRWLGPEGVNEDGLACDWHKIVSSGYGVGFLNPPYSRELSMPIEPWVRKCWTEAQQGFTTVSILPNRPDTRWWRLTQHAAEIREIPHRIQFLLPIPVFESRNALRLALGKKPLKGIVVRDGDRSAVQTSGAGFPSAVVIWRPQPGIVGPALPRRITWDYLKRAPRAA